MALELFDNTERADLSTMLRCEPYFDFINRTSRGGAELLDLIVAGGRHHAAPRAVYMLAAESDEEANSITAPATVARAQPGQLTSAFPPAEVANFRSITHDTLSKVQAGDQAGARARITDLEIAWDDDEPKLKPMDQNAWHTLDKQIDGVLTALRAQIPDSGTETQRLTALLTALG